MEDDRVSLLEQQLAQAKLIAEEADKKYEEVGHEPANEKKKISIFSRRTCGSHFATHFRRTNDSITRDCTFDR